MTRRVLVPYDGGEPADAALSFAMRECPDAEITILHVVEPFPDHTAAGTPGPHWDEWRDRAERYADETLERARQIASDHDGAVRTEWRYGRPRNEIVEYLRDEPVDQVVMGSHNQGSVSRLILGSVAEAVVRRSPVPVTIVRERSASAE